MAAVSFVGAGWLRDLNATHAPVFLLAAGLCVLAAGMCGAVSRRTAASAGA